MSLLSNTMLLTNVIDEIGEIKMQKTLIINAHPDFDNKNSYANRMQEMFLAALAEKKIETEVEVINLYDMEIPRVAKGQLLTIWNKLAAGEELTQAENEIADRSAKLLAQFKENHRIVIVMPLHNFNSPSQFKDYFDNVFLARETFKYTETGSVGLMTDDYKVMLLQASGGIYTNNDRYTPLEFSHFYIREMFVNMMGFDKFYLARAQGTTVQPVDEQAILTEAKREIETQVEDFYKAEEK